MVTPALNKNMRPDLSASVADASYQAAQTVASETHGSNSIRSQIEAVYRRQNEYRTFINKFLGVKRT